jgi:hypothetical protein
MSSNRPVEPATTLKQAYRNCVPTEALRPDHPWYIDLGPARGGSKTHAITRRLEFKPPGDFEDPDSWERILFLGLRGSGKTTELNGLRAEVRHRYEVVYLEANTELNAQEFDLSELVLAMAIGVERHFREFVQKPLPERLLDDLRDWFATVTHESIDERTAEVKAAVGASQGIKKPKSVAFFGSIQGMLKVSRKERQTVVERIRRYPGELVELTNKLLRGAAAVLKADNAERELLVIVDNLDRYGSDVVDASLAEGADHVRGLCTNLVLTPPINLVLNPRSEPLNNLYHTEFMYTPALRQREDPLDMLRDPGRQLLSDLVRKRLDPASCFASNTVLDRLLVLSGGSPRDLLELIREAIIATDGDKVSEPDVDKALSRRLSILRDQVNLSGDRDRLVHVARAGQLGDDAGYLGLLYKRWVLKYNSRDWYALHPSVAAVPEVRIALSRDPER